MQHGSKQRRKADVKGSTNLEENCCVSTAVGDFRLREEDAVLGVHDWGILQTEFYSTFIQGIGLWDQTASKILVDNLIL